MELKGKVVRGFTWVAAEKLASAVMQVGVSLVLLNMLLPEDYASIAIITAIVAILNTFVDSGFSQTLIRDTAATERDLTSVFYFNVAVAAVIYAVFASLSGLLADLYSNQRLAVLGPVLFLLIPVYALSIIQQTVLSKRLDFKKLSKITFISYLLADICAVTLALCGAGIWALVAQRMGIVAFKSLLLWLSTDWKPSGRFSPEPLRRMYGYSSRLFATDLINNTYNNISSIIMGKIYPTQLGYYDQAYKLKDMPVDATMKSVQSVTLPALAEIRSDESKFRQSTHKIVGVLSFCIFPMMAGLIATAPDIFSLFLPEVWQPSVPFFKVLCLAGMMTPLAVLFNNTMKIRSNGKVILRLEIVKKSLITLILAVTIPQGAMAIAWGQVAIAAADMLLNFAASRRYSNYRTRDLAADLLPPLLLAGLMFALVWGMGFIRMPVLLRLPVRIVSGVAAYAAMAAVLRPEAWMEVRQVIANFCKGNLAGR